MQLILHIAYLCTLIIVPICLLYAPLELAKTGSIPLRIVLSLIGSVVVWGVVIYLSPQPPLKFFIQLAGPCIGFTAIGIIAFGADIIWVYIFDGLPISSIFLGSGVIIAGLLLWYFTIKVLKSKWLNEQTNDSDSLV